MRRRLAIAAVALALYGALLAVVWAIGSRQAAEKTEAQLDYAVLDFHATVPGAIDTMLGYIARTAVRNLGKAEARGVAEMAAAAEKLDVDELSVIDRDGIVVASNDPLGLGFDMASTPETAAFLALTNPATVTVAQPFRLHANNPSVCAKYVGFAFPGGDGFVQVGLSDRHLARMLPEILSYIFDEWLLGRTGFFLCADAETDRLVSNPSRHRDEAATLSEAGFDARAAAPFEEHGTAAGKTFRQTLFGEPCDCRAFVFCGHRFVAALPLREYYGTRTVFATVFGGLLFAVIALVAAFTDRVLRDAGRLKAFYAAEEAGRARDMEIASTIQHAALPAVPPGTTHFRLAALSRPAKEVGGDFYDFFPLDGTHEAFLIADVSGKGVTAALYMMTTKALIGNAIRSLRDPAAAMERVNAELCANNPAGMFLTAWAGVLDLETGEVLFANAGHNPPAVRRADGSVATVPASSGPLLAVVEGAKYEPRTLRLAPGDALFLYTDGVTEATDAAGRFFGDERFLAALRAGRRPNDPAGLCEAVRSAVAAFTGGGPPADDLTLLAITYDSPAAAAPRTFPATAASVPLAADYLAGALDRGGCTPEERRDLEIILDEVAGNIVRHSGATAFRVVAEFHDAPRRVQLVFSDDGCEFDPLARPDPDTTLSAEDRPVGGLGILMVKRLSDEVLYKRARNRNFLLVEKRLSPRA